MSGVEDEHCSRQHWHCSALKFSGLEMNKNTIFPWSSLCHARLFRKNHANSGSEEQTGVFSELHTVPYLVGHVPTAPWPLQACQGEEDIYQAPIPAPPGLRGHPQRQLGSGFVTWHRRGQWRSLPRQSSPLGAAYHIDIHKICICPGYSYTFLPDMFPFLPHSIWPWLSCI